MSASNETRHHLPTEIVSAFQTTRGRAQIAVVSNRKGGTGKTTAALFVGEGMALLAGLRVLLIDTDRQCNLSNTFGLSERRAGEVPYAFSQTGMRPDELLEPPIHPDFEEGDEFAARSSSAEVMMPDGKPVLPYPSYIDDAIEYMAPLNPLGGRLDVLPGDGAMLQHIHSHVEEFDARSLYVCWATWLYESNALYDYDLILFDTPPFDTALHEALYTLVDHTIVPVQACNDTLSAASAIAYATLAAHSFDKRPRSLTTLVNPPTNRLTLKEISWLERTIWSNQFLGALPHGSEFPRARAIHERRDTAIPAHDESYLSSLPEEERIEAERQVVKDARELMIWQRPADPNRKKLWNVVNLLSQRIFGKDLPDDPYERAKKPAKKSTVKAKSTRRASDKSSAASSAP